MQMNLIICCQVYLFAEGVKRLLEQDEELRIWGIACNDQDIKKLMELDPDVIVSDNANCRKVLEFLSGGDSRKVLLVNERMDLSSDTIKSMIAEGLGGILPKDADSKQLLKAIRKIHEGELWIDHQTLREVLRRNPDRHHDIHLTKKEIDILNFVCSGFTNKEIANRLFISEQTVKSHCNHLFKKFGVSSRLKLALCAPTYFPEGFAQMQ
jgi:DNA-binding NarL/FixJ family response regulator